MNIVNEAFVRLWPNKKFDYVVSEEYNRRLSDYNANISLKSSFAKKELILKYNLKWKNVDSEIRIGLIQHLLVRLLCKRNKDKKNLSSWNIDLYNDFCKRIPEFAQHGLDLSSNCVVLRGSFGRINGDFFANLVDEPKLVWGKKAVRRLASYNYHNDSITVSSVFKEAPKEMLDLIMYHEVLHKVHGFHCKGGRTHTHTPEFKKAEKLFPKKEMLEKDIEQFVANFEKQEKNKSVSGYKNFRAKKKVKKNNFLNEARKFLGDFF